MGTDTLAAGLTAPPEGVEVHLPFLNYHAGPELLLEVQSDHLFSVLSNAGPTILDDVIAASLAWLDTSLPVSD